METRKVYEGMKERESKTGDEEGKIEGEEESLIISLLDSLWFTSSLPSLYSLMPLSSRSSSSSTFSSSLLQENKASPRKEKKKTSATQLIYFYALKYIRYHASHVEGSEGRRRRWKRRAASVHLLFLLFIPSFFSFCCSSTAAAQDSHLDLDDARFPRAQLLMNMDLFFWSKREIEKILIDILSSPVSVRSSLGLYSIKRFAGVTLKNGSALTSSRNDAAAGMYFSVFLLPFAFALKSMTRILVSKDPFETEKSTPIYFTFKADVFCGLFSCFFSCSSWGWNERKESLLSSCRSFLGKSL